MSMLAPLLIYYLVLLSGCYFGCAYSARRFEELLPLWCITIVLCMFLFGITGFLAEGVYFILILSVAACLTATLRLKKTGTQGFCARFFSSGFRLFALLYLALIVFNRGRLILAWDDYSHWGDVVKVMTTMDVMSTSPLSLSLFQEYPPALALFEYLLQKLIVLCGGEFTEWPMFLSYQVLFFSLMFPFFRNLDFKKLYSYIIVVILFLSPLPLYREVMSQLMVDPFLGMAFGCALGHLFLNRESRYGRCAVLMYAALLVLVKSSGLLFAALLALGFVLTIPGELTRRGKATQAGLAVLSVLLPKLLWELNIKINHATYTFNLAGDIASHSGGYRVEAAKTYILGFFDVVITDPESWFPQLTPFLLTLFSCVAMYFICRRLIALHPERRRNYIILGVLTMVSVCVYIIGLGITYLFSFTEREALMLASYGRYLGSAFFAVELLLLLLAAELIRLGAVDRAKLIALVLCIEAVFVPWNAVVYFFSRSNVEFSINKRQEFAAEIAAVEALPEGEQRIYTVCCDAWDNFILRYNLRPDTVNPPDTWWATGTPAATSAQEWCEQLAGEYDYVLLHTVADSFYTDFADAFVPGTEIRTNQLYAVDPETGLLSPAN